MAKRVLILAEGDTEEAFIGDVLAPYLSQHDVFPIAKKATTRRNKDAPDNKGGVVSYEKVKNDLKRLLGDSNATLITTMIDFYGLPTGFPGIKNMPKGTCYVQVNHIEREFKKDINQQRFLPYFQLHEFEALLFSSLEQIEAAFPENDKKQELNAIRKQVQSPEEINTTIPPYKRLKALYPKYKKRADGLTIAQAVGIDTMRRECPHFDEWIQKLETLNKETTHDNEPHSDFDRG